MLRKLLSGKSLLALALPVALCGMVFAGGADCDHHKAASASANGEAGTHCNLAKNVKKTAKITDDGAVVTLAGKNDEAVEHIKSHLSTHEKGEGCKDCPLNMADVTSAVKMTDKGGEITLKGSTPDAVKAIQHWAKEPAGACCSKHKNETT